MTQKTSNQQTSAIPFVIAGDGRVYINKALILAATITNGSVTDSIRPAS